MPAAAQAVAAPAPAPAPQNDAAEHAALVAELDAEDGGGEEAPVKSGKGAAKPATDVEEDAAEEGTEEVEGDDAETVEDEEEATETFETVDELREHLKSLAASGDVRKIEESLGLEAGTLKVNGAKLRYVNGQVEKAAKAVHEANVDKANAQSLRDAAKEYYGPFVQAKQLYQTKEPQNVMRAIRAVEAHLGEPLTAIVEAAIKAGKGEAGKPHTQQENSELAELRSQVQNLLQRTQQQQTAQQVQATQARHVETIATKLKGTELSKLKDGAKLVYDKLISSYDPALKGYKLKLPDAIKATLDDPATKWRLHELKNGRGKPVVTNGKVTAPVVSPQRKRVVVAKAAQTPQQAEEAERAALIAELEAEERRAERAARKK